MGGGQALLQVEHLLTMGCAFAMEALGEGVDHRPVLRGQHLRWRMGSLPLLPAQGLDAAAQIGVGVEEVEADASRP